MTDQVTECTLSREEMIAKLLWNSGGYGFGICSVAASMLWAMDAPGPGKPDLVSIVAVTGPAEKYTDEELRLIVAFAERATAAYDRICRYRRGANLIVLDKCEGGMWLRKRLTWEYGQFYSTSLEEALAVMERN